MLFWTTVYIADDAWPDEEDWEAFGDDQEYFNQDAAEDFLIADDPALASDEFSGPELYWLAIILNDWFRTLCKYLAFSGMDC